MRRGTTPTLRVTVDADIHEMGIHLTLKCGRKTIDKTGGDLEVSLDESGGTVIVLPLTQADTLAMNAGQKCEVQIRAVDNGGAIALASTIGSIPVDRILLDGELHG